MAETTLGPPKAELDRNASWTDRWRRLPGPAWATGSLLLIYLASRLTVVAATATVAWLDLSGPRCGDVTDQPINGYGELLRCWDTQWFLRVAAEGYPRALPADGGPTTLAFFPGYPATIAAGDVLGLSPLVAALVVSLIAGAIATLLVERMGRLIRTPEAARRAAVLFAFFPGAVVFSWGYSEALAVALAGIALVASYRERWLIAGLAAALAGSVRADVGIALTVAMLVAAALSFRHKQGDWRAVAAVAASPIGILGYLGFVWAWTGSATTWSRTQSEGWDQHMDWGKHALTSLGGVLRPWDSPSRVVLVVAVAGLAVAVLALVKRPMPLPWLTYVVVLVGISLVSSQVGFRPRAEVLLLPAFVAVGMWMPHRHMAWVVPGLAALQVVLTVLWLGAPLIAPP
ncbi:mannosyltransferase family protein [Kineosporia babensis]|uniref:Mannosyltransferase PIG-V n=1 Tax=Kineosporia babensis TaxID=499548 RepID=A0A9X1NAV9_9ACTN|nr:mannosyltransferase family protein [Kineosporia babensis]MCD5310469.1 hypothetical protein [Kineosporia babensis]